MFSGSFHEDDFHEFVEERGSEVVVQDLLGDVGEVVLRQFIEENSEFFDLDVEFIGFAELLTELVFAFLVREVE